MAVVQARGKFFQQLIEHPEFGFMLNATVDVASGPIPGISVGDNVYVLVAAAAAGDATPTTRSARFFTWSGSLGQFDMNGVATFGLNAQNRLNALDISGALDAHGNSYDLSLDADQPTPDILYWTLTVNTQVER